jgi:hypothetical protein
MPDQIFDDLMGVYIIWENSSESKRVVYVGGGNIREEIYRLRNDNSFEEFQNLKVAWSKVDSNSINGVVNFLVKSYSPLRNIKISETDQPISVNLPW